MDFLGTVNRVLVNNFILKGDDDLISSFDENQHEATIRLARNAIQTELNNLLSFFGIDYERATGQITTVAGTRTYALPADFVRFYGTNPYLYNDANSTDRCYEYTGGEDRLRKDDYTYLTNQGYENYWYWHSDTSKMIAFYQVPDAIRVWNFEYEKNVGVTGSADTMPFQAEQEAQSFADMCARRFKYLHSNDPKNLSINDLEKDNEYITCRQTLFNLMQHRYPNKSYGRRYRSTGRGGQSHGLLGRYHR